MDWTKNIGSRLALTGVTLSMALVLNACAFKGEHAYVAPDDDLGISDDKLTDISSSTGCSITSKVATLDLTANAATWAIIGLLSPGSTTLAINGVSSCGGTTMTTSNVSRFIVTGGASDETVIIDLQAGSFAAGSSSAYGLNIDLGANTDTVKIRGSNSTTTGDKIYFGEDDDTNQVGMFGSDNNPDWIFTSVGAFTLALGPGADTFKGIGNTAADLTEEWGTTGSHPVTVYGGEGADTLQGGLDGDTFYGNGGSDTFLSTTVGGDGADTYYGYDSSTTDSDTTAVDKIDYTGRTSAVSIYLNDISNNDGESSEQDKVGAVANSILIAVGGSGADTITGGTGANVLYGAGGADYITGSAGNDTVYGDSGDDTIIIAAVSDGTDKYYGGAGTDWLDLTASNGNYTIDIDTTADDGESSENDLVYTDIENIAGGDGNDVLTGSSSANVLRGGSGNDSLVGGSGDDILIGEAGNDTLVGGAGDDTIYESTTNAATSSGSDVIQGGAGTDLVSYGAYSALSLVARGSALTVTMGDATANDGISSEADDVGYTDSDVENFIGGTAADTVTGSSAVNTILGGSGNDTLNGGSGDDLIDGEGGADTVDCGAGSGDVMWSPQSSDSYVNCEL